MRYLGKVVRAIVIALLLAYSGGLAASARAEPQAPRLRLVLYSPAFTVQKPDVLDLVVEVINDGEDAISVSTHVRLDQVVEDDGARPRAAAVVDEQRPTARVGEYHLRLTCAVPAGNQVTAMLPRKRNATEPEFIHVAAGESGFVKVALPDAAVEPGTCSFRAMLFDREVKSNALQVACAAGRTGSATRPHVHQR